MAYVGESDVRTVEARAKKGDNACSEALAAMCYQIAKDVGSKATTVCGRVDAILLTGGIAHSDFISGMIEERVRFIAPVYRYPGEYEMQSLALNTLAALNGEIEIKRL